MKKKTRRKSKRKIKALPPDVRKRCLKKFRSKHQVITVLQHGTGFKVSAWAAGLEAGIRTFEMPAKSEVPMNLWQSAHRELAVWFARYWARHKQPPSIRNERGRRRRIWKKLLPQHQKHMETKSIVRAVSGLIVPPEPTPRNALRSYIVVYDPAQRLGDTVFRVHSTSCARLDMERRRVRRPNRKGYSGDSWLLEAETPQDAIAQQVAEFEQDRKEYESSDFLVHDCEGV